jgi:hypothetical protein
MRFPAARTPSAPNAGGVPLMLSPTLVALNCEAFVLDGGDATTVELPARQSQSNLADVDLGDGGAARAPSRSMTRDTFSRGPSTLGRKGAGHPSAPSVACSI